MSRFDRTPLKTERAQALRNNATSAERRLWFRLKGNQQHGFRFRRQHPIGSYVLDFYCPEVRLCVELDGDQHGFPKIVAHNLVRTKFLERKNICVIRFWNYDIYHNVDGVVDAILDQAMSLRRETKINAKTTRND
ncbi:endonuclease domain-containing protein [Hyphococcus sp.]|uniref:endonuclease domain-containing protein n=1 Tax=Hyphococcus sp. TaxID=2038636 RepID=UPI0020809363|nr:MAG: hypothetical protein DHS20C04_13430 [Marinicaulis sp.]